MADKEKKLSYREVPAALKYVIKTLWHISPSYVIISILYNLKDRLVPYITLFIAANITSKLPGLLSHKIEFSEVVKLLVLLLIVELVSQLIDVMVQARQQNTEAMVSIELREQFYRAYARLPYRLYEDKSVIDAFQFADQFMYRFSQFGLQQIVRSLGSAVEIIAATIALSAVAWYMPIIFLLFLPFLVRAILLVNREQTRTYIRNRPLHRRVWAIENLFYPRHIKETRLYSVVDHFLRERLKYSKQIQRRDQRINIKRSRLSFIQDTEIQIAGFIASAIALWRIANQGAPLGIFVLAQQLTSRAGTAVSNLFRELGSFDQDLYGFAEYRYITETLQVKADESLTSVTNPNVAISNMSFHYPDTEVTVLKKVSMHIPYGSSLAIVGENGAGKTTLMKLLVGLYRPTEGKITVNGQDLAEISEDEWLSRVGILLQDFGMNEDMTIREAVWLGDVNKPQDD
jgi:ATP-binding cassette subfamily B protein